MEVYVARQPIFDRQMNTCGYELLYRRSENNFYEGDDDTQATADVIHNAFLVMQFQTLTGGTRAFINFSQSLIERGIPHLLPSKDIVIEITERVEPTERVIEACRKLKEAGYTIALDDFVLGDSYLPLLWLADIVKVDIRTTDPEDQSRLIQEHGKHCKFLAEKVETREEYQDAVIRGFSYFQGYFFSKPVIHRGRDITGLDATLVRLMQELNADEVDYQRVTETIERDIGLSYKLLKTARSLFYGARSPVTTIKQALVRLGVVEVRKWIYLMMLKGVQVAENRELVDNCLVRGRMMELIALEAGLRADHMKFFLVGLFSSIDVLLQRGMADITEEMALDEDVRAALLGEANLLRRTLNTVLVYEQGDWENRRLVAQDPVAEMTRMSLYFNALQWIRDFE